MRSFAIGVLSERTGVKVPTIRFYESIGLLPAPERTQTNRRTYDEETVKRLRFIRHARELGFEVEAIRALLDLAAHPERPCADADVVARQQLADIDDRIERLTGLRAEIQAMLDRCTGGQVRECRIIEVLADHGE
ncbi:MULTISPECIES: MerR family transcriptional regulator [unclassified Methylobacterium]|jgi:DNA-binding transcriptional MerR regulator|uniref:MerR family transcriptional regulator n=1 Tax=unclassified Methylobacterium TaxID=2615210 RepID=UPI001356208A|nr:helix-turn-helix domain-containing protein [Methylobacterium sp. 2A]MWV24636.1 helix-turn-helix domain-containing protein [Methylobacterium sp. 2A]